MTRVSLSTWSLEQLTLKEGKGFDDFLPIVADLGVRHLDLMEYYAGFAPLPRLHQVNRQRRQAAAYGLSVLSCWFRGNWIRASLLQTRQELVARLEDYLAVTAQFEASYLTVHLGAAAPGVSVEEGHCFLERLFTEVIQTAENYGVTIAIETAHAYAPYDSPAGALRLIKAVGSPRLALCPDWECWRRPSARIPAKMYDDRPPDKLGPLPLDVFTDCLPYAPLIHAKLLELDDAGEEPNIPVADLMAAIRDSDFGHDVTIEYEGWIPELSPELDLMAQLRKAVSLVSRHVV